MAAAILVSAASGEVFAATPPATETGVVSAKTYQTSVTTSNTAAADLIAQAIQNREEYLTVSSYNLYSDDLEDLQTYVLFKHPELYYIKETEWKYLSSGGKVVYLHFVYPSDVTDSAQFAANQTKFNSAVQQALSCVSPSMTNAEKALALHDYLVNNTAYVTETAAGSESVYTAYGILVNHQGVCQGYALAYQYLLSRCSIPAYSVTSDSMNHAWNMVQLDGAWYHVDNTFDDPVTRTTEVDYPGLVDHENFLLSDTGIASIDNHTGWNTDAPKATSTKYDDAYWKNIETNMIYHNGLWYYEYSKQLKKSYFDGSSQSSLPTSGGKVTALTTANGCLIYAAYTLDYDQLNYKYQIRQINFDGTGDTLLKEVHTDGGIYKLLAADNKLTYTAYTGSSSSPVFQTGSFDYAVKTAQVTAPVNYGSITLDTRSYIMAPRNLYDVGVKLVGASGKVVKVYSSRDGIATVAKLYNGNYRITAKASGVTYVVVEVQKPDGTVLTHASIKVTVQAGVRQHGEAVRAVSLFPI